MKQVHVRLLQIMVVGVGMNFLFQNCAQQNSIGIKSEQSSTDPGTIADSGTNPPSSLLGEALYANKCSSCHQALATSNLKGREITALKIGGALNSISAMASLKGSVTDSQIDSIVKLFTSAPVGSETVSSFSCPTTEAEKINSIPLTRLTGPELQETYKAVLPATTWSNLAGYVYLLPKTSLNGDIANLKNLYTETDLEQISRFNEEAANKVIDSNANIASFFGACATMTSFTKTCFDTFLSSKGSYLFRSLVATDDNTRLWTIITGATGPLDQMKLTVQLFLNDPRFLYHTEFGEGAVDANGLYKLSSYEVANRLSYGMTGAPPDTTLWAEAVANRLTTVAAVDAQVTRIAGTNAFKDRVVEFFKFYIGKSAVGAPTTHVEFLNGISSTGLDAAVTEEFAEYVKYIVFTQQGTLLDLLSSQAAFPKTTALASIMNTARWTSGAPMIAPNHFGIVSRPYFTFADTPMLKLVQRGRMIRMNMLCSEIPEPTPTDLSARVSLSANDLITLNRRDYIDKATLQGASCIVCHSKMNQVGFATENYDSIGRYITTERIYDLTEKKVAEFPVISSSTPKIIEVDTRTFSNLREFEGALAQSNVAQQCLSRKAFQFMLRSPDDQTKDSCRLNKIDTLVKQGQPLLKFFTEVFRTQSILYKRSI